ncbi:VWA domain-containing protein [Rhizobium lemnae]|uniref:Pilus assembly protein TadG-related protein n=1 Tax=Rhizobium lemnae TaxID=1214924 RepID=A0ABV8E2P4_9HYPH|nr:TadE/TadG family type IV pilus assembly protein [Rhizobium lemnae]MCJ8507185.1 VWA domain-containing protein [Rhizobium lemnae]
MNRSTCRDLLAEETGNFAIMTAILLPLTIGVGGVALDLTNVMREKAEIQNIADAATLSAASKMSKDDITEAEATKMANDEMVGQYLANLEASGLSAEERAAAKADLQKNMNTGATITSTGGTSKNFEVRMNLKANVQLSGLTRILGFEKIPISISSISASAREGNALSMYLVLDESGSMAWDTTTVDPLKPTRTVTGWYQCGTYQCWGNYQVTNYVTKIAALKTAAGVMMTELLKAAAPDLSNATAQETEAMKLIRIGAVSYTHETKTEQKPAWGTTTARSYVAALPTVPVGGTDASGAMAMAYADLQKANPTEEAQHKAKKNFGFSRFIVLMTDGEMTGYSNAWNKGIDDKVRAACTQAKADGITVFTVAFMAPDKGKDLLQACASNKESYYESSNMADLVAAFGDIGRKAAKTQTRLTN